MALFRHMRELLNDSLVTTVIVKTEQDIRNIIDESFKGFDFGEYCLRIKPYCAPGKEDDFQSCFDPRCGWYLQMVCIERKGEHPTAYGFLSEPL